MPSTTQTGTGGWKIPSFNEDFEQRHNENPARYLIEPIRPDDGDGSRGQLICARIRGIVSLDLLALWEAYERRLAHVEDREPRQQVLDAIDERRDELEDHGEGHAQTDATPEELRERSTDQESESVAVLVDEDGEEIPWSRQRGAVVGASR